VQGKAGVGNSAAGRGDRRSYINQFTGLEQRSWIPFLFIKDGNYIKADMACYHNLRAHLAASLGKFRVAINHHSQNVPLLREPQ
jgi:hypothetical protein